jgi:hypothetical protein
MNDFEELSKRVQKQMQESLSESMWRGATGFGTAAKADAKPPTLTMDTIREAWKKVNQPPTEPVEVPVDLPDYLRVWLHYRTNEFIPKTDDRGRAVIYKINPLPTLFGAGGLDREIYVLHPDNLDEFLEMAEAAGAFAVDLAALHRGEVDEYGRPIDNAARQDGGGE